MCVWFSDAVKDYIQEMKAHMSQTCQNIEESLSLTSHYVDVQVSQRDVVSRCGRNTQKFLDKELIIMGDTDRKQSLLGRSQVRIFSSARVCLTLFCSVTPTFFVSFFIFLRFSKVPAE